MPPSYPASPYLIIRALREGDRDPVVELLWELNRYEADLDPLIQPFAAEDRDRSYAAAVACLDKDLERAAEHEGALLVAERGGAVVGFLCFIVETAYPFVRPEMRAYGYVADLVVADGERGRGIGTRLLAEAERLTRERHLCRLSIAVLHGNDGAARAYERFGFRPHSAELTKTLD